MDEEQDKSDNNLTALLMNAEKSARFLGIGRSLFYELNSDGRLGPMAVRLGKRPLWRRLELESWVCAGCPAREQWNQMREEKIS